MGTVSSYHRSPLMDTAFAPVPDASVSIRGSLKNTIDNALRFVDRAQISAFDAVLCTKVGGFKSTPTLPPRDERVNSLTDLSAYTQYWHAAEMIAIMNRDREALSSVLVEMNQFKKDMVHLGEGELLENGAELLRLMLDLYRRTGKAFLCDLMKELRSRLTDVSGVMHSFPFPTPYLPAKYDENDKNRTYYERMERLAATSIMADSIAMTAMIAQYSGDRRDAEAPLLGFENLKHYHSLPGGVISGNPYLSGRNPSEAAELHSVMSQMEAWLDSLLLNGNACFADAMERLYENVLVDLVTDDGLRDCFVANRLPSDDSCHIGQTAQCDTSALIRALYAYRRSVWLWRDDHSICLNQPVSGSCSVHMDGKNLRLACDVEDKQNRTLSITVDCQEPVSFELNIRVPEYCKSAVMRVNGHEIQPVFHEGYASLRQMFYKNDCVTLEMQLGVHVEKGWRDTISVYYGPWLMALPVPKENNEWRFAVKSSEEGTAGSAEDKTVTMIACAASQWKAESGIIGIPPRDVKPGNSYALALQPAAGLNGRITAFPCVVEK